MKFSYLRFKMTNNKDKILRFYGTKIKLMNKI